jgi:DNA-binding transcriptional regulator/RsmH inhibitor MraZ
MTGYETFGLYQALKLHFTSESYDFFKYNGKTNASVTTFENRKDKYHFYKLSRKYSDRDDMVNFIVANFVEDENSWVGSLLQENAEVNFRKHQKVIQSLSYTFENECRNLFEGFSNPNDIIMTDGVYPVLLTKTLRSEISIETLCVLNGVLNFFPMWAKRIDDTIRWPEFRRKCVKYASFLPKDDVKYKLILKKVLNENQ